MQLHANELRRMPKPFLLDSGADISLVKLSELKPDVFIHEDVTFILNGFGGQPHKTLGYVNLNVLVSQNKIPHTFHVVGSDFPVPFTGILGNDFLKEHQMLVDYKNNVLHNDVFRIPLVHDIKMINDGNIGSRNLSARPISRKNPIFLQPRSEVFT